MSQFDDIVFANRNRRYGAYCLRKKQYRFLNLATLVSVISFLALFFALFLYYQAPETVLLETLIEYDEPAMTNPYQAELNLEEPEGNIAKQENQSLPSIGEDPDVDATILDDVMLSIGDSTGTGTDSIAGAGKGDTTGMSAFHTSQDPTEVYNLLSSLDVLPAFPGGEGARIRYFHDQVKYPKFALDNKIQGIVYVNFIVEPDSSITNVQIIQGIGAGCDDEAIRAVNAMPKWTPGKKDDRAIRVQVTMPLTFSLITQK